MRHARRAHAAQRGEGTGGGIEDLERTQDIRPIDSAGYQHLAVRQQRRRVIETGRGHAARYLCEGVGGMWADCHRVIEVGGVVHAVHVLAARDQDAPVVQGHRAAAGARRAQHATGGREGVRHRIVEHRVAVVSVAPAVGPAGDQHLAGGEQRRDMEGCVLRQCLAGRGVRPIGGVVEFDAALGILPVGAAGDQYFAVRQQRGRAVQVRTGGKAVSSLGPRTQRIDGVVREQARVVLSAGNPEAAIGQHQAHRLVARLGLGAGRGP